MRDTPLGRTRSSRRAVLAVAAGTLVTLSGCDALDAVTGGPDDVSPSGDVTPTAPAADADDAVVGRAGAALESAEQAALAAAGVPALAAVGSRLARLHRAHLRELGAAAGTASSAPPTTPSSATAPPSGNGGSPTPPAVDRRQALRALALAERRLQDDLVTAALQARSGVLAQLLASMAASVAQQRAVLR